MTQVQLNNKSAEKFVQVFTNMKGYTDHITLFFREDGIYSQGMDSAHISMYELFFHKDWFDEYPEDLNIETSINTSLLHKVLSTHSSDHSIVLHIVDDQELVIEFIPNTTSSNKKRFKINLMSIDCETLDIPEQEYSIQASIPTKQLKSDIDELSLFGDNIIFKCISDEISLQVKSEECQIDTIISKETMKSYEITENTKMSFHMKMIHTFMKFHKLSETIELYISENIPMIIKYPQDDDKSFIRFFLAPKIYDDDDDDDII